MDENGNAITSTTHIGNLNPFRYRGYYYDTESGFYYLMSRYYDPVTHRFVNADGYFQSGQDILDANMSAYCRNNPVNCYDPTGTKCSKHDPYYVSNCFTCNPDYLKFEQDNIDWHNRVTGENVLKILDDGTFVYMINETKVNTNYSDNAIFIVDERKNSDPNIKILNSVAINEHHQLEILELIQNYNIKNPVTNSDGIAWDRETSDMLSEWNVHNFIFIHSYFLNLFFENAQERAQSVDLNNADAGKFSFPMMW